MDEDEEPRKPGARNPKVERISVRVAASIDERLNRLADLSGMNKGTMAAFCIAAGLRFTENIFQSLTQEQQAALGLAVGQVMASDMNADVETQMAVQIQK